MRRSVFRTWRSVAVRVQGPRVRAFGGAEGQISAILVINLDRQPRRWALVTQELHRLRSSDGASLLSITQRLAAVDARDGRSGAATGDVDVMYRVGDQLHVQPDVRLAECFSADEPVRMTKQEVAVARSHVEAWKSVATGDEDFVLVLEDDVWFKPGAAAAIDRGWREARRRFARGEGPKLLYLSFSDADGTAVREDEHDGVFRPVRGLWHLSGYVLSREGAIQLLGAMPVVGPVDLWMNFRFRELDALALSSPVIAQRQDVESDNSYSMLPYLARAGIVDSDQAFKPPDASRCRSVLAWTGLAANESLAMALSMLGLRVRAFDGDEPALDECELRESLKTFDALVDAPLTPAAVAAVAADERIVLLVESDASTPVGLETALASASRSAVVASASSLSRSWDPLCGLLDLERPVDDFPVGAPRTFRLFRDDRPTEQFAAAARNRRDTRAMDESPWTLPEAEGWQPADRLASRGHAARQLTIEAYMTEPSAEFYGLGETFPGNLASFVHQNLAHTAEGTCLTIEAAGESDRHYRSGAFASVRTFGHGRFEAEIRAAVGPGLVTGFFLHRATPLQEIDIEIVGSDPRRMLTNVYFNPGDDGTAMSFGYRGSPCLVDLGFDASADFHRYAIDWRPGRVTWLVDDLVVHERVGWDPTPIPHLEMRLYANLWAPRSGELAGRVDERRLPATATFRSVRLES